MKLILCDINSEVVTAWEEFFHSDPVTILKRSVLEIHAEGACLVSPANSFGYMCGGIDLVYRNYFGKEIEQRVQQDIKDLYGESCPVGDGFCIATQDLEFPYLMVVPTMITPGPVADTANAYDAFMCALEIAVNKTEIKTLICPGLCTLTGKMNPRVSAMQMKCAFNVFREDIRI